MQENFNTNYYQILGVQNDATPEEIKKAYRERLLQNHPDKNQDNPQATEQTKKIIEAYKVLSDESKRKEYDQTLKWNTEQERNTESFPNHKPRRRSYHRKSVNEQEMQEELIRVLHEYLELQKSLLDLGNQLVLATYRQDWETCNRLIQAGADLNRPFSIEITSKDPSTSNAYQQFPGWRPLHFVIHYRHFDMANFLLDKGADPNWQSDQGFSPLHIATYVDDLPMVINLRQKGAYPHFTTTEIENTPLNIAIREGRLKIAAYLIDNPSNTRNPFATAISSNNRPNCYGQTPLKMAIGKCQEDPSFWNLVAKLLQRPEVTLDQADVNKMYENPTLPPQIDLIVKQKIQSLSEAVSNEKCVIS